jgi:sec-independent protein translocase protein TatA
MRTFLPRSGVGFFPGFKERGMFGIGTIELLIIVVIAFFILGGRKIPEISRGFGLALRNFKKGLHEPDAIDVTPKKDNSSEKGPTPSKPQ